MDNTMTTISFEENKTNYLDQQWVTEHAETLFKTIDAEVHDIDMIRQGVTRLVMIYPRLVNRDDIRQWVKLSENTLRKMRLDYSTRDPLRPEYTMSDEFIIKRMDHSETFVKRTKRQRHRLSPRQMFETYLILIMALYYDDMLEIDEVMIQEMLAFAGVVNHPQITFKLYQTLSFIYARQQQPVQARNFAEMAYEFFAAEQQSQLETALTAYTLAESCYQLNDRAKAEHYAAIASQYFTQDNHPRQHLAVTRMLKRYK